MVFIKCQTLCILSKPPTRFVIAVMMFIACFTGYMMEVNLSVNIIAMTYPSNSSNITILDDTGPRYKWNQFEQGLLLSSYFCGYMIIGLFGGILAENLGGKETAGYCMLIASILTALSPWFASMHFWVIFACRLLIGFVSGTLYPCCHYLISRWAPPDEKGVFVASLMGGTFGTVIAWLLSGVIIQNFGWHLAFYIFAIIAAVVTALWFIIVANRPSEHKWISEDEKKFIEYSLSSVLSGAKKWPPMVSLLKSGPFWALQLLHFGSMWGLFFLLTAAPKFMNEALKFDLKSSGFLSSLPYLARLTAAFIFGAIGDAIRKRDLLSVTKIRKCFCLFSHIIPGILLFLLAFFNKDPYVCVIIMTMSLGFNGAATLTNLQNFQDLAPNYAGTLYGIINFLGTLPGILSPMIVAYFVADNSTIDEWRNVFFIGGTVYILTALVFLLFGSGEIQKWNYAKEEKSNDTKL